MGVEVDIFLFGKPEWEIGDLESVSPDEIRALGDELKERLYHIATIMEKLADAGWERYGASLYSISFHKEISEDEAVRELERLGINVDEVNLMEVDEDEEDIDEIEILDENDEDEDDDIAVIELDGDGRCNHEQDRRYGNITRELMLWQIPISRILKSGRNTENRCNSGGDEDRVCS